MQKQTLIEYYEADTLWKVAVGTWAKLAYEWLVVAVIPGIALTGIALLSSALTFRVAPAADSMPTIWAGVSTTILGYSWCFSTRISSSESSVVGAVNSE